MHYLFNNRAIAVGVSFMEHHLKVPFRNQLDHIRTALKDTKLPPVHVLGNLNFQADR